MSDTQLRGTRSFLWLALLSTCLGFALLPPSCFAQNVEVTMFGPKQYARTTDSVNVFTQNFRGIQGKGTLMIQNGDGNGHNLVSDLLILINGVPLLDWSKLMQPGHKLEDPILMDEDNSILVIILGKPGSYLTIQEKAEITPDATTSEVVGIAGGRVSVQNHLGDRFTLQIPPLALDADTSISISALPNALPSPIANSVYPGAVLEPEGLLFSLPVSMSVILHGTPPNSNPAMLFWFEDSSNVLPIGQQTATQNSIAGQNFHFSTVSAGAPTTEELGSIIVQTIKNGPGSDLDKVQGLLSIAAYYQSQGDDADANNAFQTAQDLATNAANAELKTPLPPDPCGKKATANNIQLSAQLQALGLNSLANEIMARDCSLELVPVSLSLFVGQTWDHNITATLKDPRGKTRSCSVSWYDSDQNVATIAASGHACVPTGVGSGVADISAICDGVSSSTPGSNPTRVSVCSLSGTYQGGYSGVTIGCVQKAPDGSCLKQGPKSFSGSIAIPFTQNGTSVSAVIMGYTITGTNNKGSVTLGPVQVPCKNGTATCPAGLSGTLSSDCSTLVGSFYVHRPRPITGTFSIQLTTPQP